MLTKGNLYSFAERWRKPLFVAFSSAALLFGSTGCELLASVDRSKIKESNAGQGGAGGGGQGGAGGGGQGGSGGMAQCSVGADCPGMDNECGTRTCESGVCGMDYTAAGTPVMMQAADDCKVNVCDGMGAVISQNDDADVMDDGNACTDDACSMGTPSNMPSAVGTPCSAGQGTLCDGMGVCVECLVGADCMSGVCMANLCVPPSCADTVKNGNETDVDCGGADCAPCNDGLVCGVAADCVSGVCTGSVCQVPGCADNVKNGLETGVDCGGGSCPACADGGPCVVGADCASGVCTGNVCQAPACGDGVKNGSESDVDCGGTCPADCADGQICGTGADCASGVCTGNVCQAPACGDGVKNGSESDVDCGGTCPADCADGQICGTGADCASGVCTGNVCQAPACGDGVKNGSESDVDCGGTCPADCADGQICGTGADCASGVCTGNVCQAPACGDGVKNGSESDVDCGGTCPADCADGQICGTGADCASGVCTGNVCQAPACGDGVKNGSESDVDCGGPCPADCADGQICGTGTDCASGVCTGNVCQAPACGDGVKNGSETDVDCGGSCPVGCADGQICGTGVDCTSGVCTGNVCQAPACGDGIINGTETCEDGNAVSGDCCSACTVEPQCSAESEPNETCPGPDTDGPFTPSVGGAFPTEPGVLYQATIDPVADQDYFAFTIPAMASVAIETFEGALPGSCPAIDTLVYLYGSDCITELASDDDDGLSTCSLIDPAADAGARMLAPGTYYVRVHEYQNDEIIPVYNVTVKLTSLCGNGLIEAYEACDDGNLTVGDGCSDMCAEEAGFNCDNSVSPSVCVPEVCGDGSVDAADQCDDGNVAPGDGCSATCIVEAGFVCFGSPSVCVAGSTEAEPNGACPDFNGPFTPNPELIYQGAISPAGDQDMFAFTLASPSSISVETFDVNVGSCVAADTIVRLYASDCTTEIVSNDDAGISTCSLITPANDAAVRSMAPGTYYVRTEDYADNDAIPVYHVQVKVLAVCGDSTLYTYEGCDDGNAVGGDGCAGDCTVEAGYVCSGSPSVCVSSCGDGVINGTDTCDDGNTANGDGCSSACAVESGYSCSGAPSVCVPACGNGSFDPGEKCDDNNTANGDGCSSACLVELDYQCSATSPSVCSLAETLCGDGVDNDGDSFIDALDSDCALAASVTCGVGETLYVYNSVQVPQSVMDNASAVSDIFVTHPGTVTKAVVQLDITHSYDGDLEMTLRSALGTSTILSSYYGGGDDNYTATIFDSSCATPIGLGIAPFNGCYSPDDSLFLLNGEMAQGIWTLDIFDTAIGDTGTLNSWSLALCATP